MVKFADFLCNRLIYVFAVEIQGMLARIIYNTRFIKGFLNYRDKQVFFDEFS